MIEVRYFASLRERLGAGERVDLADVPQPHTVGGLRDWLCASSTAHAEAFDAVMLVRAACNQVMCEDDEPLEEGAEVAFFPPVTGG